MCSQFPMCLRSLEQEGASHFTGEGTAVLGGRPIWPASDGGVRQRWDLTWVSWTPEKHSSPWDCVCICSQEAWRATVQAAHCLRPSTPGRVSGLEPSIILDVRAGLPLPRRRVRRHHLGPFPLGVSSWPGSSCLGPSGRCPLDPYFTVQYLEAVY